MSRSLRSFARPTDVPKGADALWHRLLGWHQQATLPLPRLRREAEQALEAQGALKDMSGTKLRETLETYRETRGGAGPPDPRVTAAAVEAAHRTLGLQPYPVQVMGALALRQGFLIEMATGEGKTLTAALAAALGASRRNPCHVITVNDYLVTRDAQRLREFYQACGLEVGWVVATSSEEERRKAYRRPVVYVTSREVAADFLRDSLRLPPTLDKASRRIRELGGLDRRGRLEPVLPGLYQAIVDEADSVLIDEAVTPLILSARGDNQALVQAVRWSVETAGTWEEGREYRLLPRYREVELTRAGRESLAGLPSGARGILGSAARREEMVRTALAARAYHLRGKHYLVSEGKITIVDEFTGRPMPDRSWRQGIQQAVELGEGLEPSPPAETVARISFQGFFRLYHRRSGMTGTGREVAGEFWRIYGMPFVEIPRQRPCRRVYLPTRWFGGASDKADAIIRRALSLCAEGRAVLIGTRTERDCEHLEQLARAAGHPVSALNARRVAEEAAIIRQAGESGRLTIATNMAGRGTDILLDKRVREAGGLHVIASEFHEARRIDRQLIGRCARQGDPGSCETFASLEDQLVQHFGTALEKLALASRCRGGEGDPGPAGGRILRRCQVRAERLAHQRREAVLRHDIWLRENLTFAGAEHG